VLGVFLNIIEEFFSPVFGIEVWKVLKPGIPVRICRDSGDDND
jgi:hypothetical protein